MSIIEGRVEPRFAAVEQAFRGNFEAGQETGAGLCVYHRGRPVVDIWGGLADPEADKPVPWRHDTLAGLASTTKALAVTATLMLVDEGRLELDAPITSYWPDYAPAGSAKARTTVRMVFTHQAGLVTLDHRPLTVDDFIAYTPVVEAIETAEPAWPPGTAHGYHGLTIGHLLSELIRRVTGMTVGRFLATEICDPLGLDCYIGLPESKLDRLAKIVAPPAGTASNLGLGVDEMRDMYEDLRDPESLLFRSTFGSLHVSWESANDLRWVLAEAPSSDGTASAASLARFFAMLSGEVDGVQLLSPEIVDQARTPASTGEDRVLRIPTTYGLGYALPGGPLFRPLAGAGRAFGAGGATGSLAYADPEHDVALAYVPNRMSEAIEGGEERVWSLVEATYRCL